MKNAIQTALITAAVGTGLTIAITRLSRKSPDMSTDPTQLAPGDFPLEKGDKSQLVQELQLALIKFGGQTAAAIKSTGGADGDFGTGTLKALQSLGYSSSVSRTDYNDIRDGKRRTQATPATPDTRTQANTYIQGGDKSPVTPSGVTARVRSCPSVNDCPITGRPSKVIYTLRGTPVNQTVPRTGRQYRETRYAFGFWPTTYYWFEVTTPTGIGWVRDDVVREATSIGRITPSKLLIS